METTQQDAAVSRKMAGLYARWIRAYESNPRTKEATASRGKLIGAAELAYELGYGLTPLHVVGTMRDNTDLTGSALAERFTGLRIIGQRQ